MKNLLRYANALKRRLGNENIRLTVFCLAVLAAIWLVPTGLTPYIETKFRLLLTGIILMSWYSMKSKPGSILHFDFPYFKDGEELTIEQQYRRVTVVLWACVIGFGLVAVMWLPEATQWIISSLGGALTLLMLFLLVKDGFIKIQLIITLIAAAVALGAAFFQPVAQAAMILLLLAIGAVLQYFAMTDLQDYYSDYYYDYPY